VVERLGGKPVVVPGPQRHGVGATDRIVTEPVSDPILDQVERAVEHPGHETECKEVLGTQRGAALHAALGHRRLGQLAHRRRHQVVAVEGAVRDRIGVVAGLGEVALVEGIGVDEEETTGKQVFQVRSQGSRVHRDQDVGLVTRRQDVAVGDLYLERRDPGQRALGCANLRREIREGRQIVAEQCGRRREAGPGQLHSVT
jgi:hypothetical protein